MSEMNRLPSLKFPTIDGAAHWFEGLAQAGLIFHPDDDPADVVYVNGAPCFTSEEVVDLRGSLARLDAAIGHAAVIDAAYRPFMLAAGHAPEVLD